MMNRLFYFIQEKEEKHGKNNCNRKPEGWCREDYDRRELKCWVSKRRTAGTGSRCGSAATSDEGLGLVPTVKTAVDTI